MKYEDCMDASRDAAVDGLITAANDRAEEVEETVIEKFRKRRNIGRAKYGTSMERVDFRSTEWLNHAQEEAMDLAIYLEKLMRVYKSESAALHVARVAGIREAARFLKTIGCGFSHIKLEDLARQVESRL